MQRVALREALLRRTGTVPSAGVRDGPGSAAHRSARAPRCAASGARKSIRATHKNKFAEPKIPIDDIPSLLYIFRVVFDEGPLSRGDSFSGQSESWPDRGASER